MTYEKSKGTPRTAQADIIAIGNEILLGKIADSNSHWLANRLFEFGLQVRQITAVADDLRQIAEAIDNALNHGSTLIITTGGLGPSKDDMTLSALAAAFHLELRLNDDALRIVRERYEQMFKSGAVDFPKVDDARKKMAILPEGGEPIYNGVGAAPGVILTHKSVILVVLPGVPLEMKDVFERAYPLIARKVGRLVPREIVEVTFDEKDESVLAPIVAEVETKFPNLSLKPLSEHFGKDTKLSVRMVVNGSTTERAATIKRATELIQEGLSKRKRSH